MPEGPNVQLIVSEGNAAFIPGLGELRQAEGSGRDQ
jgi:hypothetical protein